MILYETDLEQLAWRAHYLGLTLAARSASSPLHLKPAPEILDIMRPDILILRCFDIESQRAYAKHFLPIVSTGWFEQFSPICVDAPHVTHLRLSTPSHFLSAAKMSITLCTLPSFPVPGAISLSTRVPIRMSVATLGVPKVNGSVQGSVVGNINLPRACTAA